jgi:transposase
MNGISLIGVDLAKNVFQVHGVDQAGRVVLRRQLRRSQVEMFFASLPACAIAMEACPSAHFWARSLAAHGHQVYLVPPKYVKPFVKRSKNDAVDAEAIVEAASRPNMRFVPVKTEDQQSVLMLHRARSLLTRQETAVLCAIRGHFAEFGIVEAVGAHRVKRLIARLDDPGLAIPDLAREVLGELAQQLLSLQDRLKEIDRKIRVVHRASEVCRRLETVPGIGPVIATAIAATVPDASEFRSGREFAAWLGLVPRQNSTGGKARLGGISKQGNTYLRRLLIVGANSVMRWSKRAQKDPWLTALRARKPHLVAAVALANKIARIAWAIMKKKEDYRVPATA